MKDNLDMLSEKLQSLYSYPKSKADKEVKEMFSFTAFLRHAFGKKYHITTLKLS